MGKTALLAMLSDQALSDSGDPKSAGRVFLINSAAINLRPSLTIVLIPYLHSLGDKKMIGSNEFGISFYFFFVSCTALYVAGFLVFLMRHKHYVIPKMSDDSLSLEHMAKAVRNGMKNKKRAKVSQCDEENDTAAPPYDPNKNLLLLLFS